MAPSLIQLRRKRQSAFPDGYSATVSSCGTTALISAVTFSIRYTEWGTGGCGEAEKSKRVDDADADARRRNEPGKARGAKVLPINS